MNSFSADVLVIGGGIAGYRAAVAAAENGSAVTIVEKGPMSSNLIMGFNTFLQLNDNAKLFLEDLQDSSCRVGNSVLKQFLVDESRVQYNYLLNVGFPFDKDENGNAHQIGVLGCRIPRLVHSGKNTGSSIHQFLKKKSIELGVKHINGSVVRLLLNGSIVVGASGFDDKKEQFNISAKAVIVATGGYSALFKGSTYPAGLTGDGIALALNAGAKVIDMEFMQFEPCTFYYPESLRGKLAVTTMLLKGGKLTNNKGEEFTDYRCNKHVLANRIMTEVKEGRGTLHGGVNFDVTNVDRKIVTEENALFYNIALKEGIDFTKDIAEVGPAPHTGLGGIMIDEKGRSSVEGLYACGEAAGGIHGANRIGGCSGTEVVAYGAIAGRNASEYAKNAVINTVVYDILDYKEYEVQKDDFEKISETLTHALPFYKTEECMQKGLEALNNLLNSDMNQAAKNLILTAKAQLEASLMRKESRGVFARDDYSKIDSSMDGVSYVISLEKGNLNIAKKQFN